jgi:uncharacterized protein YbjT (DUF2867 family)
MRIAVVGGTGSVGRYAVQSARDAGHEVVVISRGSGVDARSAESLTHALTGVEVIIDAIDAGTLSRRKATAFFGEVTANLQSVGAARGVSRLVTLSIVGLERAPGYGYYAAKKSQEAAAMAGPLPVNIVRATQFFEFPSKILSRAALGPVAVMPIMRVQPVAARSVGAFLVEVATAPAQATTVDVAGPEQQDLVAMARSIVRRRHRRIAIVPLWIPGGVGVAMRGGALVPTSDARIVGPTFAEWLDSGDAAAAPS